MENLSKVLGLNKNMVNGYESFNSIAIVKHLLGSVVSLENNKRSKKQVKQIFQKNE